MTGAEWTLPRHRRYHEQNPVRTTALNDAPSHRLLIADDHPLFRGALREAVHGLFGEAEIAEAGSFEEVSDFLERGGGDIDLVLLDLSMPGVRGFSGLMYLRAQYPSLPIAVEKGDRCPVPSRAGPWFSLPMTPNL